MRTYCPRQKNKARHLAQKIKIEKPIQQDLGQSPTRQEKSNEAGLAEWANQQQK